MAFHGGDIYTAAEIAGRTDIIDFSANINPFGVPDSVSRAIAENMNKLSNYPDTACRKLIKTLGDFHSVNPEYIVCGNGGADLIFRLADVLRPKNAIVPVPSFSEYGEALEKSGCNVEYMKIPEPFEITDSIFLQLEKCEYDFLALCSPNNPTGLLIEPELLEKIIKYAEERNIFVLLDECFYDMTGDMTGVQSMISKAAKYPNMFVLKSMTKMYAIPGLRLGYGVCSDAELIQRVSLCGQPWPVNSLAQAAGCAAVQDVEYRRNFLEFLKTEREYLYDGLCRLGLKVWKPDANFIFFRAEGIDDLDRRLLPERILIRHCDTYRGLDSEYYRTAVKQHNDNQYLLSCLEKIICGGERLK